MAASYTTTTTTSSTFMAKMVEKMIREAFAQALFLTNFVTQKPVVGSKVGSFPMWPAVPTAAGVSEGTDTEAAAITPTANDITVSEVVVNLGLTKFAEKVAPVTEQDLASLGTRGIANKVDSDLAALFSGFSGTVGSTGNEITLDTLIDANTLLDANSAPPDRVVVLAPKTAGVLRKLIAGASGSTAAFYGTGMIDPSFKKIPGFVTDFLGTPVYQTTFTPKINTNADFCGAMFCREALGLAVLSDVEVDVQLDASLRAKEVVCTSIYGVGELNDKGGIGIVSKVAA